MRAAAGPRVEAQPVDRRGLDRDEGRQFAARRGRFDALPEVVGQRMRVIGPRVDVVCLVRGGGRLVPGTVPVTVLRFPMTMTVPMRAVMPRHVHVLAHAMTAEVVVEQRQVQRPPEHLDQEAQAHEDPEEGSQRGQARGLHGTGARIARSTLDPVAHGAQGRRMYRPAP